ncbi:MAG: dockerin type I repeat-containing protein [candidate division Zixibacteria bacterium]|nr:dockerin type I repeat-containing protein [candidate division Zixibacteria bacterium]
MKSLAKMYLMAALLCGLIVTAVVAGDVRDDDRVVDSKVINSQQYAFPAEAGDQALGSSGGSSRGVGLKIGTTWWDQQQIGSMGRMIDYGITPSDPSQLLMQFTWTYTPGGDPSCLSHRTYRYEAWDAGAGNLVFAGGIDVHPPHDLYGGYVGIDITVENQALLGGHLKPTGGDFNSTFFRDWAPGVGFFAYQDSIPNALANYCAVTPPPPPEDGACWPKFRLVEGPSADTFLHVIALEGEPEPGDPAALVYYRLLGSVGSPTATWDNPPYCVDTVYVVGHDIAADDYGKVAITWIAQKHDITDPCNGGDTCSGLGGSHPLVDNDVYYQITYNNGDNWNPRQNITKNYNGSRPYRPYTDLSAFIDSKNDFHVAWGSREWDNTGPPYKLSGRIFHWSEDNPFIRSVHLFLWNQPMCNGGYWMLNASKMTISECDGRLYCLFVQFNDVPNGLTDDCAAVGSPGYPDGAANGDLFVCVSDNYGLTWDLARNLTYTYTPGCDSVGGVGGPCASENWPSMTKFGTDFVGNFSGVPIIDPSASYAGDWYLDVQYILDQSPGAYTNGLWPNPGWKSDDRTGPPGLPFQEGNFTEADVEWFRLACVEPVETPIVVPHPVEFGWLWVQHGVQFDTSLIIENTGNATLNYSISIVEDTGPAGWLGVGPYSGVVPAGLGNADTVTVSFNQGGIVNSPGTEVDLTGRLIINSNAPSSPDTIETFVHIIDTLFIPKLNASLIMKERAGYATALPGVLIIKKQQVELWTSIRKANSRAGKFWNHHVLLNDPDGDLSGISQGTAITISGYYTSEIFPKVGKMTKDELIANITVDDVSIRGVAIPPSPSAPSRNPLPPPRTGDRVIDPCKFAILVTGYCDDDFVNDINQKYDYKKNYADVDPDNIIVLGPAACLEDFDAPAGTTDGAGNFTSGGAFPATEDNVQKAFEYIKQQMIASGCSDTEFQFHSSSHGGGNHTAAHQVPVGEEPEGGGGQGWCGGQVDPPGGDEANRISENDLRFDGRGQGTLDVNGDTLGDLQFWYGPPPTVYHDADGDGIFEEDELVGTDTNGDGYIDKLDDDWTAPDLDGTGGISMIGVDDIISLGVGGSLVDDELADLISDLIATPGTGLTKDNCRAEMDQCFSGSFIDDLAACVGEHATACEAGEYSYGNGEEGADAHGEYEYPFIEALKSGATWEEAHNEAVDSVEANEVPETPQFSGGDDCCEGLRGNVDDDGEVNIADLTYLVAYLFTGGPPPPCLEEADVNGDGEINIADLTYLVAYLFTGGPPPVACP